MASLPAPRNLPSSRWTSLEGWDYNGMKQRLQLALTTIDKPALTSHAELIKGQKMRMSQPFSAGQYWICFEIIAEDETLMIARVRLPRHPDVPVTVSEEDEVYAIDCEVTTMEYVRQKMPSIPVPRVYAYERMGSRLAKEAGATGGYMLLEGFNGNTLQDVEFDICSLSESIQEHIVTQWTKVQTELATLSYPQIGSISEISEISGEPVIGKLAAAFSTGELSSPGPFSTAVAYFTSVADAAIVRFQPASNTSNTSIPFASIGAFIFHDIIQTTTLFQNTHSNESIFPLNHMDLGTQNILIDEAFNFLAIIDWEFAQTAPWQVNRYPMPFPLTSSDIDDILKDPEHIAYRNVSRQERTRKLYKRKFEEAEQAVEEKKGQGQGRLGSFAETLDGPASRIYACFTNLGRMEVADEGLVGEMVRLAFGFDAAETEGYIRDVEVKIRKQLV